MAWITIAYIRVSAEDMHTFKTVIKITNTNISLTFSYSCPKSHSYLSLTWGKLNFTMSRIGFLIKQSLRLWDLCVEDFLAGVLGDIPVNGEGRIIGLREKLNYDSVTIDISTDRTESPETGMPVQNCLS